MAFGRLERTAAPQPMSDINITPLVDVMLVLVVIFLLTAPLLASAIRLDLPRAGGSTPGAAPAGRTSRSIVRYTSSRSARNPATNSTVGATSCASSSSCHVAPIDSAVSKSTPVLLVRLMPTTA